jgi:WD40 repeat protein
MAAGGVGGGVVNGGGGAVVSGGGGAVVSGVGGAVVSGGVGGGVVSGGGGGGETGGGTGGGGVLADGGGDSGSGSDTGTGSGAGGGGNVGGAGASGSGNDGVGGGGLAACGALDLSSSFQLAPAAAGQRYVRCDTLGPEGDWQVTVAPDGGHLAARTGAGTLRLIATRPWREVAQIASPLGRIDAAAFSPDGASLAVLSAEMGQVTLWNAADGALARTFAGPPASSIDAHAASLAFSSDGARLATSMGTVIDLGSGARTSWQTGQPDTTTLVVNPETAPTVVESDLRLAFTAGDAGLFVYAAFQIGNSPTSARLSIVDPATGQRVVIFEHYDRALLGVALADDGRTIAVGVTPEGASPYSAGLRIHDAVTGAVLAQDATFTGTVLGFSRDGARLYTQTADTVSVVAVSDLHLLGQFTWPAGTTFLGVAAGDQIVGSVDGATSWWSGQPGAGLGAITRTRGYPLSAVTWSPDGAIGAGTGDPAALFHLWSEANGAEQCAPPPRGAPAPALASLGTLYTGSPDGGMSDDGSVLVHNDSVIHAHSANWASVSVKAAADQSLLRLFTATSQPREIALSHPSADKLYTGEGNDVAAWCR